MSFRQHNKNPEAAWRKEHREELLRLGMPDFVLDDEPRWHYVLLHAADEFESRWDPSWITPEQAAGMLELLRSHYTNPVGLELLRELKKRANAKASA
jgi:hypothetical protein